MYRVSLLIQIRREESDFVLHLLHEVQKDFKQGDYNFEFLNGHEKLVRVYKAIDSYQLKARVVLGQNG
mgnify:CR=1 FL=1